MKRILFASIAILLSMSAVQAGLFRRGGCCPSRARAVCAPRVAAAECPVEPVCTKTIMIPKTIQVPKVINVPARKIVTPRPDLVEYIPQPCLKVRRPQPDIVIKQADIIEEIPQPDKVRHIPQPPCVRYECPPECDTN